MPTLLVVDDCPVILALHSTLFCFSGFSVLVCDSGRKALACLEQSAVDLIITDFNMPGIDGFCMAKQARANGFEGPILMATGADLRSQPGHEWVDEVIAKAQGPEVLLDAVRRHLATLSPGKADLRWAA